MACTSSMSSVWEASTRAWLYGVHNGNSFTGKLAGDVGCVTRDGVGGDFYIESVLRLPEIVKKGDLSDVRQYICDLLQIADTEYDLACCGEKLPNTGDLDYYTVCGSQPVLLVKDTRSEATRLKRDSISIATLSGKMIPIKEIEVNTTTVEELKNILQDKEGIPPDQQRLIYDGKQMDDKMTLNMYGVQNGSIVHFVLRLRGGGAPVETFVDLSTGKTERMQWSESAPTWRIARQGLNIEGRCTNSTCKAFNHLVIMGNGMGAFDLIMDQHTCKCPICQNYVKPVTAAFSNCKYRWAGIKAAANPGEAPKQCQQEEFKEVGDEYLRFDESSGSGNGVCDWLRLKIYTVKNVQLNQRVVVKEHADEINAFLCPITQEVMKNPVLASDGHSYEEHAIKTWISRDETSPLTREPIGNVFTRNHALRNAIEEYQNTKNTPA